MIAVIFAGIFGPLTLGVLFAGVNAFFAYTVWTDQIASTTVLNFILAGELPILVSYILWHGKSHSDKTKERAYYDLANELDQVSNKAEVVIGAISDGVIAIGSQGQIELINPAAQRIVGWGHQDAISLNYKSVLQLLTKSGSELEKANDPVFEVLANNQPVRRTDLQLQTSSGKKIDIEIVVSPIGRIGAGAIIVFSDVTKEQAEERAQAEFISTASHEMRTPVASIEGYLGLALNPATATVDARAHDFIGKAHSAAQHLGRLFQDLLDVTKADDGRLSNNPKAINVVQFVGEIIEGLQPKANEKNLRLFFRPVQSDSHSQRNITPEFYVNVDNDHLREVMSNLIENGIKYTPAGQVVIDVKGDDTHVIISVTDSGIGIPAEDIPHLFQKFYRVDNSDTREIGGTGLGLYLCRRLAEAMGGRIWVDSEYKKGSTFSIELARITHEDAMHLIEAASAETGKSTTTAYVATEENPDRPTAEQRAEALATPIIVEHSSMAINTKLPAATATTVTEAKPTPAQTPPVTTPMTKQTPQPEKEVVDPLMSNQPTKPIVAEPARPRTGIVLPAALQAVESNLKKAAPNPAPATARPVTTPATPPAGPTAPVTTPISTPQPLGKIPTSSQVIEPTLAAQPQTPAPANNGKLSLTVPERQKT